MDIITILYNWRYTINTIYIAEYINNILIFGGENISGLVKKIWFRETSLLTNL